jgi:hypothetical protein
MQGGQEGVMGRFSLGTNRALAAAVWLLAGASTVGCSKRTASSSKAGTVKLALTLPDATTLDVVSYKVIASDGITVLANGAINTSDRGATPSVDVSVVASMNDKVNLHGVTSANVVCDGTSVAFNVIAGQVDFVAVTLVCGGSQLQSGSGSVIVNGTVVGGDNCPVLQSWMASPLQSSITGQIDVSALATDADTTATPPQTLSYAWTASAGTFVNPTSATTKYNCSVAGDQTLTITVSDDYSPTPCTAIMTFPVKCINPSCGDGHFDPATEQCDGSDPTDPNHTNCDANCHLICGNLRLDPGEQCDPPKPGICSATCQYMSECGDGIVAPGEQCDPPDGVTCDATCHTIAVDVSLACQNCENAAIAAGSVVACSDPTAFYTGNQMVHFGCYGFAAGPPQTSCSNLLSCLRTSSCSGINGLPPDDFSSCFCGSLTSIACLQNNGDPTAKCYAQYNAALAAVNVPGATNSVATLYVDPRSPIGIADNIAKCDVDAMCDTTATCGIRVPPSPCGNGVLDAGEQCDPPVANVCSATCQFVPAVCGDGHVQHGEDCEPPNTSTCDSTCHFIPHCGDGHFDPATEQCDASDPTDPNRANCDASCHLICGNGKLDAGEQCDPPVANVCSATCQFVPAVCGDGFVQHGEDCEPPNTATCDANCHFIPVVGCTTCEQAAVAAGTVAQCADPTTLSPPGSGTSFGCDGFTTNAAAKQACVNLLACLRTSHCNSGDNFKACFCGALSDVMCLTNNGDPTAACYSQYNTALSSLLVAGATNSVPTLFADPRSPIGIADNLVKCDVDGMCNTAMTCGVF